MRNVESKIFTKDFIVISSINLLIMLAYYLLFVVTASFSVEKFSTSPSMSGLVAGLMVLGCLLGRFVTGHFITVIGGKKILFTGLFIYTLSMGLYLVIHTLPLFIVIRFISGLGVGFIGTATGTLVAHIVPQTRRGVGISFFSLSTIIGLAAGPFLGILLMQLTSYEAIFGFTVFCGIASLIIAVFLGYIPISHGPQTSFWRLSNYLEYQIIPFAVMTLCVSVSWGNLQAFISVLAEQKNLMHAASMFFLFYAAVAFGTRPVMGMLYDKYNENIVVYPALLATVVGLLLVALTGSGIILLLAAAILGFGIGNFQSISQVISLKLVQSQRFGQATSTYFIFLDLGVGFGPYLFGFLVPWLGYVGLYVASAVIVLTGIPFYLAVHGQKAANAAKLL